MGDEPGSLKDSLLTNAWWVRATSRHQWPYRPRFHRSIAKYWIRFPRPRSINPARESGSTAIRLLPEMSCSTRRALRSNQIAPSNVGSQKTMLSMGRTPDGTIRRPA